MSNSGQTPTAPWQEEILLLSPSFGAEEKLGSKKAHIEKKSKDGGWGDGLTLGWGWGHRPTLLLIQNPRPLLGLEVTNVLSENPTGFYPGLQHWIALLGPRLQIFGTFWNTIGRKSS